MSRSPVGRVARAVTAPVRGYLNQHFEMVKEEVRAVAHDMPTGSAGPVVVDDAASWQRVAELENTIAELSLYQTRVLNRLCDDVSDLAARIDELDHVVTRLAAVTAASHDRSIDTPPTP